MSSSVMQGTRRLVSSFSIVHAGIMYSATPNIVQSKLAMSDGIFFFVQRWSFNRWSSNRHRIFIVNIVKERRGLYRCYFCEYTDHSD